MSSQQGDEKFKVGTLQYTKAGLFVLFGWLLWGDFCFQVFETVGGPGILGAYLQDNFHVSNSQVNTMFTVIPQFIAIVVGPPLSFKSDRYRSRWGRRIPFMFFTAPILCVFAASLGFADVILSYLKTHLGANSMVTPFTATMIIIGFMIIGFTFFNEFVNNVYWYLFADVVPQAFMGRFVGLFRMVGSLASFLINNYVAGYQLSHMMWVHVGVAALYFFGFGMMCIGIKEGEYPPPTDVTEKTTLWEKTRLYCKQCFSHPIFYWMYAGTISSALIGCVGTSLIFSLHLDQHAQDLTAHKSIAAAAMFFSDDRQIISGGQDKLVKIWGINRSNKIELVRNLAGHQAPVACVAICSDCRTAASGSSDGQIKIWDAGSGECARTLPGHAGGVTCLALFRDGQTLVSGGADAKIKVWNLRTGELLKTLEGHEAAVHSLAVSEDEHYAASGGADKTIRVWNVADWTCEKVLKGSPGSIYAVAFLPALEALPEQPSKQLPVIGTVASYFKDVFCNESLYDVPAEKRSRIINGKFWLAAGGRDGEDDDEYACVRIWDLAESKILMELKGHKQAISSLQYKPDLRMLLSGSRDGSMRLWDPTAISEKAGDQAFKSFSGYTSSVTAMSSTSHGPWLVNASDSGHLHLWNMDKGVSLRKGGLKASFFNIISILLAFPTGMLVDRFHPLRITLIFSFLLVPAQALYFFFAHDYMSMLWLDCLKVPLYIMLSAAGMPLIMMLYPKSKYGQFCAAASTFNSAARIVGGILGAIVMDGLTNNTMHTDSYRYVFLWYGFCYILITVCWVGVYGQWKKLGGMKYVAPQE